MKPLVLLDAGHGSDTAGKRSPKFDDGSQLFEYEFNRDVAKRVQKKLRSFNFRAELLVPEDNDVKLATRCERANSVMSENPILISIHVNAYGDGSSFNDANGWSAYTSEGKTEADKICQYLYQSAEEVFKGKFRLREANNYKDQPELVGLEENFYILKHTKMPAVLVENLFMTNKKEAELLKTDVGRETIAEVIFRGLYYYLNQVKE